MLFDSHILMQKTDAMIKVAAGTGAAMAMDRVERVFVGTAITGFLVMAGAIIWMMMS